MSAENDQGPDPSNPKIVEIGRRLSSRQPPRKLLFLVLAAMVAVWVGNSTFYKVNTEETGVVLRFGRFSHMAQPGLNFKLPFGIDKVFLVKTGRNLKEEFGFRTAVPGVRTTYNPAVFEEESLTLTGDLNVSDVEWIVQYQIVEPFKFLFQIQDPQATIRDIAEAVVRRVVGNSNVTQVLTTDRAMLAANIEKEVQSTLRGYDIGIRIVTVKFQDVNPPDQVKAAFNEVNESEQQKESLILQARGEYNREVPKARGVARSRILEAEGYAVERINRAEGERARFLALLEEYRKAPEVTRRRLYLETMEQVLPKVSEIYVLDHQGGGLLPHLPLRGAQKEVAK
ncbi:MAG: FtsH protease activity modulator HflK [Deltaproteobacteria bacterium]|nr:FtsH protease activity modulator HflK [Deltaproteobacteria bacterium]